MNEYYSSMPAERGGKDHGRITTPSPAAPMLEPHIMHEPSCHKEDKPAFWYQSNRF